VAGLLSIENYQTRRQLLNDVAGCVLPAKGEWNVLNGGVGGVVSSLSESSYVKNRKFFKKNVNFT
jgi:hypothetical protein